MHAPPFVPHHQPGSSESGYQPASSSCGCPVNVGQQERVVTLLASGGLLLNARMGPRKTRPLSFVSGAGLLYRGLTGHCYGYEMLGISTAEHDQSMESAVAIPAKHGVKVEKTITIQRSPAELFQFWRKLENLPKVMSHLASVTETADGKSHWVAYGPFNKQVEWDAEIYTEGENEFIGWRSLSGSDVDTAGSVHFRAEPNNRGTSVVVSLKYNPPGGKWVAKLAGLIGQGAEQRIAEDLKRFKSLMETGEIPTVEGQPHGQRSSGAIVQTEGVEE